MSSSTSTRLPRLNTPFIQAIIRSGLLTPDDLLPLLAQENLDPVTTPPLQLAAVLVRHKRLTKFQAMQLLNGRTRGFVLGSYKILDGIRQDRVGMVFLAERSPDRQLVALKVLPTDRASDPTILQEFLKEVRAAARVHHPNLARVLDISYWQGTHFVVCEYVPGTPLDRLVTERGPLPPHAAAQIIAQAAVGLHAAHAAGLIHRDIKPANIVLTPARQVKVLDLGLTHMLENPWARVTRRINTKEYAEEIAHIAPEEAWGCPLDARSDIYSLGSTFYYLLTGEVPFPGLAPAMMAERQLRGVPSPRLKRPDVPPEIDQLVQKMGAREPHARFASARDLLIAMHPWLPLAQWQALGLLQPEAARPSQPTPPTDRLPPSPSGGWLRRLLVGLLGRRRR